MNSDDSDDSDDNSVLAGDLELVAVAPDEVLPLPLDTGYAWIIDFAFFMNSFVVDGVANSFGLLLPELCLHFQAEKASVSAIGALLCGACQLVGPLVGSLTNKFGCRWVCISGGIISTVGFIVSSYAVNMWQLAIAFGLVGGVGFGLIYLPSMVSVSFYFERRRALAMGLGMCGTGVGTIVMGPITSALLSSMGWRNTLMLLGGLSLNSVVFGALLRPIEPPASEQQRQCLEEQSRKLLEQQRQQRLERQQARKRQREEQQQALGTIEEGVVQPNNAQEVTGTQEVTKKRRLDSERRLFSSTISGIDIGSSGNLSNPDAVLQSLPTLFVIDKRASHKKSKRAKVVSARRFDIDAIRTGVTAANLSDLRRPLYRKDIFYGGSVLSLAGPQPDKSQRTLSTSRMLLSMTRIPEEAPAAVADAQSIAERPWYQRLLPRPVVDAFLLMTDFSVMRDPGFAIVWFGNLLGMMAFHAPIFFVSDYSLEIGASEGQSRFLNSAFGAANTISRVAFGWLAGRGVSPLLLNNATLLLSGILAILFNACGSFVSLLVVYTLLGVTLAPFITTMSEILCQLVGLEKLTSAFGLVTLARGISTCIGSPMAGSLYNETTKYILPFTLGGCIFILSSVVFSAVFLPSCRNSRRQRQSENKEVVLSSQNLSASLVLVEGNQVVATSVADLASVVAASPYRRLPVERREQPPLEASV